MSTVPSNRGTTRRTLRRNSLLLPDLLREGVVHSLVPMSKILEPCVQTLHSIGL